MAPKGKGTTRRGFLRAAAAAIGVRAVSKGVRAFGGVTAKPQARVAVSPGFQQRVSQAMGRHKPHYNAALRLASSEIAPGRGVSRLEHAKQAFAKSRVLPQYLRETLPYVPFVESAFRTGARSKAGAVGMWQFMPGTGKRYGLVGKGFDHRRDPEKATEAAVRYFEGIYGRLSKDPHYLALKRRYNLRDDQLLHLAVINAFNSGEAHMVRAMEVMGKEKSVRADVDRHARHGGEGLFHYVTTQYAKDWKRWQKPVMKGPYYIRESPAYPYKVVAYRRLHEGGKPGRAPAEAEEPAAEHEIKASTAPAPNVEKANDQSIRRYEGEAWSVRAHARKRFKDFPKGHDAFTSKSYMFNQRMADAAFELYRSAPEKNEEFLVLSQYYYARARGLAREQLAGKPGYRLPRGGKAQVRKRAGYCDGALRIVEGEFGERAK